MDVKLVVTSGAKLELKLPTVIGRSSDAQLKVRQHNVSRRHCEVFEKGERLMIQDLGSSNGTIVNGKRIRGEQELQPGDEISIGTVSLCVVFKPQTGPVAAAAGSSKPEQPKHKRTERFEKKRSGSPSPKEAANSPKEIFPALEGSAVLRYQPLDDGSFIDIDVEEAVSNSVSSDIDLDVPSRPIVSDHSRIDLDVDAERPAAVEDDSKLDKFLDELEKPD